MLGLISAFYFLKVPIDPGTTLRMLTFLCNLKCALTSKNWSSQIKGIFTRAEVPLLDLLREPKVSCDGGDRPSVSKAQRAHISWPCSRCCRPVCARASHQTPCSGNDMAVLGAWVAKSGELVMREAADDTLSREIPLIMKEKERKEAKCLQAWTAFYIW